METALKSTLQIAIQIAKGAGEILKTGVRDATRGSINYKSSAVDPVTEYDRQSEAFIVRELQKKFPSDAIVGEEGGTYAQATRSGAPPVKNRWYVDPIDGTVNFAHGIPIFCVSLGLVIDGVPSVGVVYNPMTDELFCATVGGGATLNDIPIGVSAEFNPIRSLLITGFPYDRHTSPVNNFDHFVAFKTKVQAVRRLGSAALDLCFVACGRAEGYWELKLKAHDIAAGILIVSEAGGQVTDFSGAPATVRAHDIVASNRHIHPAMLEVLNRDMEKSASSRNNVVKAGDGI